MDPAFRVELLKVIPALTTSLVTLCATWFIGVRITSRWDERKKRRELSLSTADAFYRSYGEFFAVWKEWSALKREAVGQLGDDLPEFPRTALFARAASAEGAVEGLILKLAVEHELAEPDMDALGCFRQAYQVLRKRIRDDEDMGWYWSDAPEYRVFKGLATRVAQIVARDDKAPDADVARDVFRRLTSNYYEGAWVEKGSELLGIAF